MPVTFNYSVGKPDLFNPDPNDTQSSKSDYDGPMLYRYPIDLGNSNRAHYMVIHINEQVRTSFANSQDGLDVPTIYNRSRFAGEQSNVWLNTIIPASENLNSVELYKKYGEELLGLPSGNLKTIRRTRDTIALYMPDTLNFDYNQNYDELKLAGFPTALIAGGVSAVESFKEALGAGNDFGKAALKVFGKNVSPFLANYFVQKSGSDLARVAFGGYFGFVQNPQLELLYSSPEMRKFSFDFMFYPRSEKEAVEVQKILALLRFHQAPEVVQEFNGFFLTPPSEFDLKFYYNGKENPNIPKISTCILHSINVDYAPNGFAAYETMPKGNIEAQMGKTGMPVAIRLRLGFKEREILTKSHFAADAGKNRFKEMPEDSI